MSYYMRAKEAITIKNVNEDTRAFTISVKKYIQDFLQGVRIESFYNFSMELSVDDKVIIGTYIAEDYRKGVIKLESLQFTEEGMHKVIENLEFHEKISLNLEYSGFFFYFYYYSISRFRILLDEKLKGYATYFANEQQEDALTAYVFTEVDGELMMGYIDDHPFDQYKYINEWKFIRLEFVLNLEDEIPWDVYYDALETANEVAEEFDLKIYFDPNPMEDSDGSSAKPGGMEIETRYENGHSIHKEVMTSDEIEEYYMGLKKIYNTLRDYTKDSTFDLQLIPLDKKYGESTVVLKLNEDKELVLRIFDPYAEELYIIPDDFRVSRVSAMEEAVKGWEDIQIPTDDSFLK